MVGTVCCLTLLSVDAIFNLPIRTYVRIINGSWEAVKKCTEGLGASCQDFTTRTYGSTLSAAKKNRGVRGVAFSGEADAM